VAVAWSRPAASASARCCRALGAGSCVSSRELRFVEAVAQTSGGGGVACVLNSLTSAGLRGSLDERAVRRRAAGGDRQARRVEPWAACVRSGSTRRIAWWRWTFCRPACFAAASSSWRRRWRAAACGLWAAWGTGWAGTEMRCGKCRRRGTWARLWFARPARWVRRRVARRC
jgi:hypothetical protein